MTSQDNSFNSEHKRVKKRLQAYSENNAASQLEYLHLVLSNASWENDEQIGTFTFALAALELTWQSAQELTKLFSTMDIPSNTQQLIADKLGTLDDRDFVPVVFHSTLNMHNDWIQLFYGDIFNDLEATAILNKVSSEGRELAAKVALKLLQIELDCETQDCYEAIMSYIERFDIRGRQFLPGFEPQS